MEFLRSILSKGARHAGQQFGTLKWIPPKPALSDGSDYLLRDNNGEFAWREDDRIQTLAFGGQFLADPNEINGWGAQGFSDDTNTQDLGNAGVTDISHVAGGFMFPFEVELIQMRMWVRNNNSGVDPYGFVITKQGKNNNLTSKLNDNIVHEVNENDGVGPRDYANTNNQFVSIELSNKSNRFMSENHVLNLGVSFPTADTTNRYVQIMSGVILYKRVL